MDKIVVFLCLLTLMVLLILYNRWKRNHRNSKALLLLQFLWLILWITAILFLKPKFNQIENILLGAFFGGALVYFFYRFRKIFFKNSDH